MDDTNFDATSEESTSQDPHFATEVPDEPVAAPTSPEPVEAPASEPAKEEKSPKTNREALEAAWADFRKHPSKFTYDDLMNFVPKADRREWHEKALDAAKGADLHSKLELFVETKEMERSEQWGSITAMYRFK